MPLTDDERLRFKIKKMRFDAMSATERMAYFDKVSGDMCSDEWREKIRRFVEK